ncbi:MAG: SanA/YdcF family protein [Putridiphycobacter sp.]
MLKKLLTSKKFYLRLILGIVFLVIISIPISDYIVKNSTSSQIFKTTTDIPYNKVGMVLGTSKYLTNGNQNAYYTNRIDATVELYFAKKIDYILISGDNSTIYYDEPNTFKNDLISKGIPADKIVLDYAGFRTLDSVVRAKKVFGLDQLTIISQKFHIERALYIANHKNIDAVGFEAPSVSKNAGFRTAVREKLARVKVMIDLLFNVQPKFLGDPIKIGQ